MAFSSLGNVIITTYSATRVKQEICKAYVLPWPRMWASDYDMSIGRFLNFAVRRLHLLFPNNKWFAPDSLREKTPAGAMALHLLTCLILIFSTWTATPLQSYSLLSGVAAYIINAFVGALLAGGMLYLRFSPSADWAKKSPHVPGWLSIAAAIIYLVLNAFPLIVLWFPPKVTDPDRLPWFLTPTVAWSTIIGATVWWLFWSDYHRRLDDRLNKELHIKSAPHYEQDPPDSGKYVQTQETVYIARKMIGSRDIAMASGINQQESNPTARGDFAGVLIPQGVESATQAKRREETYMLRQNRGRDDDEEAGYDSSVSPIPSTAMGDFASLTRLGGDGRG